MRVPPGEVDAFIARLARVQHGVVSRRQLLAAGLTAKAIAHRLRRGRLHVLHPGVYAVGHLVVSARGWWMAAVLRAGPGAILGFRAAAALWGLIDGTPARIDVVATGTQTSAGHVVVHRVRTIPAEDRAVVDGIPCTAVARTLVDLASEGRERALDRALRQSIDRGVFDRFAIERALDRARPGTVALRSALASVVRDERQGVRTKKELERRFIELLRAGGFVLPCTNVMIDTPWGSWEVDTFWPEEHLVIELDGWDSHRDRESFRRDHRRTADVSAVGNRVLRLTWEQVVDHPEETLERLQLVVPRLPGTVGPPVR